LEETWSEGVEEAASDVDMGGGVSVGEDVAALKVVEERSQRGEDG
jgi:hypothetical protein